MQNQLDNAGVAAPAIAALKEVQLNNALIEARKNQELKEREELQNDLLEGLDFIENTDGNLENAANASQNSI